jgi:hypothetical protein
MTSAAEQPDSYKNQLASGHYKEAELLIAALISSPDRPNGHQLALLYNDLGFSRYMQA